MTSPRIAQLCIAAPLRWSRRIAMRSVETVALSLAIFFVFVTDVNTSDQQTIFDGTVQGELAGRLDDQREGVGGGGVFGVAWVGKGGGVVLARGYVVG